MENIPLRRTTILFAALLAGMLSGSAFGQQMDFALGFSTLHSAAVSTSQATQIFPPASLTGGLYRPIFWDFDGLYIPKLGPHAQAEFSAGIGAESTRFYTNYLNCSFVSCTNYQTSTHFMGQFGAGLKLYAKGGLFVRPEMHLYLVNNNLEYTSPYVVRYGASIGYTFGH